MSELGEIFKAMREAGREKRASNKQFSTALLAQKGIPFESKNHGDHLVVTGKKGLIDFWPSTGKFKPRWMKKYMRGVRKLLTYCEGQHD